jgi:hypothetical protein
MRFFRTMLVAAAATTASVNAKALNQHQQRSLVDVCANVDADLVVLGIVFGKIELCLCVSAIPVLLTTNLVVELAVAAKGAAAVTAALTALVRLVK